MQTAYRRPAKEILALARSRCLMKFPNAHLPQKINELHELVHLPEQMIHKLHQILHHYLPNGVLKKLHMIFSKRCIKLDQRWKHGFIKFFATQTLVKENFVFKLALILKFKKHKARKKIKY